MAEKTEAQKEAQKKYMERFSRVELRMDPEKKKLTQNHVARRGESVNSFVSRAISEQIITDRVEEYFKKSVADHFSRVTHDVTIVRYSIEGLIIKMLVEDNLKKPSDVNSYSDYGDLMTDPKRAEYLSSFDVIFHRPDYSYTVYTQAGEYPKQIEFCLLKITRDMYGFEGHCRKHLDRVILCEEEIIDSEDV